MSVLPHRIDDLEERQALLDRIFSLLGNTILTCANDPAISATSESYFISNQLSERTSHMKTNLISANITTRLNSSSTRILRVVSTDPSLSHVTETSRQVTQLSSFFSLQASEYMRYF